MEKIKVSDKWEENGTYVKDVSILRKRVSADSEKYLSGVGGNRLIYFLAIETAQKSATKDQDLFGRVTLKQTTGDKEYRFGEIAFDVAIELGYVSASKSEGEGIIPTVASFSKRDGFEEESDYTFEFAAESNASFVVNTNGQGTIVLGMDIDFDDDIGDEYPTADLYFYKWQLRPVQPHRHPLSAGPLGRRRRLLCLRHRQQGQALAGGCRVGVLPTPPFWLSKATIMACPSSTEGRAVFARPNG